MEEADFIPLSALQHYLYCPRQCALIHVEQAWAENRFTAEGRVLHERTDKPGSGARRGVRTVTAMPIRSFRLGVSGIADVVELLERPGGITPRPVEYKRGKPKAHKADEVQLCAQGMALEEMFETPVPDGMLFYGETRRRMEVAFDDELRGLTQSTALAVTSQIQTMEVPSHAYVASLCEPCSLLEICRPRQTVDHGRVARFIEDCLED